MATAKHTAKPAAKKAAPPVKAAAKAPAKKAAPAKADHVIRAPSKAVIHKAAQVMGKAPNHKAGTAAKPQVKAAARVLSAASHKGEHTTGKEVKAIRAAEKVLTPAKKTTAAPAAKKAAAPAPKPRQEVASLVIRESKEARERRETRGRAVTKSIMSVPDARTPAKKAPHVSRPHITQAPAHSPNRIVEELKAQVRQATAPTPTPKPAATPVQPWTAEQERSFPVDQSVSAVRPHSTANVNSQRATEAAAGTKGAPVTLGAATRAAAPEPAPVQRVVASTPAQTPHHVGKSIPHCMAALAASAGTVDAAPLGAPATVPSRPAPRTEWQNSSPFSQGSTSVSGGFPRSSMAGGNGSSSTAPQATGANQSQPGLIARRFEVFSAGMGSHKWRLMDATTGQLISMGRETFGTPGAAEENAGKEAQLYQAGTCVIVRV